MVVSAAPLPEKTVEDFSPPAEGSISVGTSVALRGVFGIV
jgi:hypothetical protein